MWCVCGGLVCSTVVVRSGVMFSEARCVVVVVCDMVRRGVVCGVVWYSE